MDFAEAQVFADSLLSKGEVGGWELLEYLAHGKSAVLLKARRGGKVSALKVFHSGLIEAYGRDAQLIRINREKELIDKKHPNLISILDAGACEATGHLYVAMELAGGRPLSTQLMSIPRKNIPMLIEQLARAAEQLENWGLTHRDIKPDNIHINEQSTSLTLLDFGVVKPHGDDSATSLQVSKAFIGTHQYSPPEMIHGKEKDTLDGWRAITFYQIGAVLHDLITQKPIFHHATARHANLVSAIDNEDVVLRTDDVDPQLCNLAKRCLVKRPDERLELVRWDDFKFSDSALKKPSLEARRDALQRQLRLGKSQMRADVLENYEERRLAQIRLQESIRSARFQFDGALAELGELVPARSTFVDGGAYPSPAMTYVFESMSSIGISSPVRIQVAIGLNGERSILDIYVRASKGHTDTEVGWNHLGPSLDKLDGFSSTFQEWMLTIFEELIGQVNGGDE
ncbi:hypothetical protein E2K99_05765 [Herbaspirillum huttiense]|uniref:protein kinase domain-containing protein n=1 Tax=Herbaspirillum huttiense TaxID=863372 RepID=UPI001066C802|nr:protein kinase [Herbaspirillum huttiense]QBP74551.1 hypothetical protein E2K99_05765 [Herbaspirillum huttiense]